MASKSSPTSSSISRAPVAAEIVEATLRVIADGGLERATVRAVAAESGVAIGTVQHWFPTKDDLVVGAFTRVVARIRERVSSHPLTDDVVADMRTALRELLPLDDERRAEIRVHLAFAASASVHPALAELQRTVLDDVRASVVVALTRAGVDPRDRAAWAAAVLGVVDGLALHATSAGVVDTELLVTPLDLVLDACLAGDLSAQRVR